jgi:hypothetical protein
MDHRLDPWQDGGILANPAAQHIAADRALHLCIREKRGKRGDRRATCGVKPVYRLIRIPDRNTFRRKHCCGR